MKPRRQTRTINVGGVPVGGGAPVSVQTMANVDPHDVGALVRQAERCAAQGADLFRLTVPDLAAAEALGEVKRRTGLALVADIQFDHRCALAAVAAGADALRLNPGNIGSRARIQAVARAAKEKGVAIRIGVNLGSLEKDLRPDYSRPADAWRADVPEALATSALRHARLLEQEGFFDIVLSVKASGVQDTVEATRLLASRTDYPLHLGVTEAGTFLPGTVRSSVALGILLSEGVGDTIRVSLTAPPEEEVRVGLEILRALGLRAPGPGIVSCPTCGRTRVDVMRVAAEIEAALQQVWREDPSRAFPRIAVMGCAVNGPGEAKGADVALCGGAGEFLLYVKGRCVAKIPAQEAVAKVVEHVKHLR